MLPKNARLNLSKAFKWVVSGQKKETTSLKIWFKEGENLTPLVGVAVSGQYFKKAVLRNKARRLAAKAISLLYSDLRNNLNLVIMPKQTIFESNLENLKKELINVKEIFK